MKLTITKDWAEVYRKSSMIASAIFAFITAVGPTVIDTSGVFPVGWLDVLPEGPARWTVTAMLLIVIALRYTYFKPTAEPFGVRSDA